jgi:hypothetical protein
MKKTPPAIKNGFGGIICETVYHHTAISVKADTALIKRFLILLPLRFSSGRTLETHSWVGQE